MVASLPIRNSVTNAAQPRVVRANWAGFSSKNRLAAKERFTAGRDSILAFSI
jgi:hypothetical protein